MFVLIKQKKMCLDGIDPPSPLNKSGILTTEI